MSTGNRKRYEHIDYTKGLGILLIMLAHVIQNFGPMQGVNSFVRAFHVPVFFIASGYLFSLRYFEIRGLHNSEIMLEDIDAKAYITKRVRVLLVPYVIFSIFNSLLKFAVLFITGGLTRDAISEELVQLLITGNGTVWFLMTLFLTECVLVFLYSLVKKTLMNEPTNVQTEKYALGDYSFITCLGIVMMIFICIPYIVQESSSPIAVLLIRVVAALGYYILGILLGLKIVTVEFVKSIWCGLLLICTGICSFKLLECDLDFFNGQFNNIVGSLVSSVTLSIGTIIILYNLESRKENNIKRYSLLSLIRDILLYFGQNSLIVMLVHPTVLLCMTFPLGGWMSSQIGAKACIISIAVFVMLVLLQVPFIFFINKYVPFIVGKPRKKES